MFAGPTTLEPELLAAGNDDAVWAAWAAQQPRAWETVKAAVDATAPASRSAVFAAKLKDADLRKGDFAQDFLDAVETASTPVHHPRLPGERFALAHGRPCPRSGRMNGPDLAAARVQARAAQQQVITADPPFAVIACPGAGKTRVIVERHLARAVPVRQGRAITSFTRVAAAEVQRRCAAADRLDLTSHPHFVDTLDTFLWQHLVRPFLPADRIWRRLESWRDAPDKSAEFTIGTMTYRLADTDFSYDPRTGAWSVRPTGDALQGQRPGSWAWHALRARAGLEGAGYLTGTELRAHACRNLKAHSVTLGAMLRAKYAELIIDEAQDCSAADLYILTQLHDAGLPADHRRRPRPGHLQLPRRRHRRTGSPRRTARHARS